MSILVFQNTPGEEPEIDELDPEALKAYRLQIEARIHALDQKEPRNENSEAYEAWADEHEALEDTLDDILDRLEELAD